MPEPTEVYVVTSGSYSDYGIRRVFLDKAEADLFVHVMNTTGALSAYSSYSVETWPIGRPHPRNEEDSYRYAHEWTPDGGFEEDYDAYSHDVPDGAKSHVVVAGPDRVLVAGHSEEHVRKVIFDEVARIKAEQAGIA